MTQLQNDGNWGTTMEIDENGALWKCEGFNGMFKFLIWNIYLYLHVYTYIYI